MQNQSAWANTANHDRLFGKYEQPRAASAL